MFNKVKEGFGKAFKWCGDNSETLLIVLPIVATTTVAVTKLGGKAVKAYKTKTLQDKYCYDRSLGHYWELNRKLSNSEWLAIEDRRKHGERLSDILSSMKVLK